MKRRTTDDYRERLNAVMDHVYAHLDGDLSLARLARVAAFSPYHFHRVFKALTGETTGAFIQRARLEKAVYLLSHQSGRTIKEVGFACGFASPAVFTRAFRQQHGFAPSRFDAVAWRKSKNCKDSPVAARHHLRELPAAGRKPPVTVTLQNKPAQPYAYIRVFNPYANPAPLLAAYERLRAWLAARGFDPAALQMIGLTTDDPDITPREKCRHDCGFLLPAGARLDRQGEVGVASLATGRYAVARITGGMAVVERAWDYLLKVWLPRSGWQPRHLPCCEVYLQIPEPRARLRFDVESWIPVEPSRYARIFP